MKTGTPQNEQIRAKCPKVQYINFGEEDQMEIAGYIVNKLKKNVTYCCYFITCGLLGLIFHWYPHWKLLATHSKCTLEDAEKVLITDNYKGKFKTFFVKKVETLRPENESVERFSYSNSMREEKKLLTVYLCDGARKHLSEVRIIRCKKQTYVWDDDRQKFIKLSGLERGIIRHDFHNYKGYSKEKQDLKRITYGENTINVPVQTIFTLIVLEALTPFYVFQVFSLIVWLAEYYYYYTIAIIIMSVYGIASSVIQTRENQKRLKGTVHSAYKITVSRGNGNFEEIPASDLVPGDLIVIPSQGCEMPCDAVLLNGNCIVNESMLTGESVPITKTGLPNNSMSYNPKEDVNHTLFCGTKIIQTRYYESGKVLAVVIRTGYLTTKGDLVRSILYPPPADFKFDKDSYKFIGILSAIAFLGFIYTIVSKSSRNIPVIDILIKALDLLTIAIPPALPAAMTVGKLYALSRLKNHKIYCINSRVINVSGSVNCICFDKTGTLTEDGMDLWAVVPVENSKTGFPVKEIKTLGITPLIRGMTSCHSLSIINGEICGDPLDLKMFESTGWVLEEWKIFNAIAEGYVVPSVIKPQQPVLCDNGPLELGIVSQFQFSSTLQRMCVICKASDWDGFDVFCKGSPEKIISLSRPNSVPNDIFSKINEFTEKGYRVIAMGTKNLSDITLEDLLSLSREDVESDLNFVGLIILENRLKPISSQIIKVLNTADIKTVMITGDNIQTAVSVAKECGILDSATSIIEVIATKPTKYNFASIKYCLSERHIPLETFGDSKLAYRDIEANPVNGYQLTITGNSWANVVQYFPDLVPKIVAKGAVFARMSGQQKQQLIEELKDLGYYVAMCGDGANDCGALKAAHVGISLSEEESSIASPFTSQEQDISCVPKVIKEGRAALVTSFGVFKLMLCYSLAEFSSTIILYAIDTNLTSLEFLFIDVLLVLNFASFFGRTKAYHTLDKTTPMTSMLSFVPLMSIVLFMFVTVCFQVISYYLVQTYSWFTPFVFDHKNTTLYASYENYAVYTLSMFQYIIMAIVFSKGKPYRKPIYTNFLFSLSLITMIVICCYVTLYPAEWLQKALELKVPPCFDFRVTVLGLALCNFLVCIFVEDFIVEFICGKMIAPKLVLSSQSSKKYLQIEDNIVEDSNVIQVNNDNAVILNSVCEVSGKKIGYYNKAFENTEMNVVTDKVI